MTKNIILLLLLLCFFSNNDNAQSVASQMVWISAKTNSNTPYKLYLSRILGDVPPSYEAIKEINVSKFGGRTDMKADSTGFYHTIKLNKRWWMVDPHGYLYISKGINAIYPGSDISSTTTFDAKYGNNNVWFDSTRNIIKRYGFETAACWSKPINLFASELLQGANPINYTVLLNWMSNYGATRTSEGVGHTAYPYDCIFVFEKAFETYCYSKAQTLLGYKYDKNLLGYFSDNELPFYANSLNNYLKLGRFNSSDENYLATIKWLSDNHYSISDTIKSTVQSEFLAYLGRTYYSIVYSAIKSVDSNHLFLGSRVHLPEARDNAFFMTAIGPYIDVFSVNYYGVWTPDTTSLKNWTYYSGKPFIITEFYTKAESTGLSNSQGAGWIVKDQFDRGLEYQNFTLCLLESRNCIGWHWFKYMDDAAVPYTNGANKGIFTIDYQPYTDCLDKMSEVNKNVYYLVDGFDGVNQQINDLPTQSENEVLDQIRLFPTIIKVGDVIKMTKEPNPHSIVKLFDLYGRDVSSAIRFIDYSSFRIANLKSGYYMVKINNKGQQISSRIIVL